VAPDVVPDLRGTLPFIEEDRNGFFEKPAGIQVDLRTGSGVGVETHHAIRPLGGRFCLPASLWPVDQHGTARRQALVEL